MLSGWETGGLSRASKDPAVANDKSKSTRDQWENFLQDGSFVFNLKMGPTYQI